MRREYCFEDTGVLFRATSAEHILEGEPHPNDVRDDTMVHENTAVQYPT